MSQNAETFAFVAENLASVRAGIAEAAKSAGRDPSEIRLIAVSKTKPAAAVRAALAAGQTAFGENRVQELQAKQEELPGAEWHLVGPLQTNKVKFVAPFAHTIHTLDSVRLMKEIEKRAARIERTITCLIQVNISDEDQKFGVGQDGAAELLRALPDFPHIRVEGLMGIAENTRDEAVVRGQFARLRETRDRLAQTYDNGESVRLRRLSMGMTHDYPLAVAEGATDIRVGSAIFGARA